MFQDFATEGFVDCAIIVVSAAVGIVSMIDFVVC